MLHCFVEQSQVFLYFSITIKYETVFLYLTVMVDLRAGSRLSVSVPVIHEYKFLSPPSACRLEDSLPCVGNNCSASQVNIHCDEQLCRYSTCVTIHSQLSAAVLSADC